MRDAYSHRNASVHQHLAADLPPELGQVARDAGQVGKFFINAVGLRFRHHRLDDAHHALGDIAVQRVVAAESDDAMPAQQILDLKIGRAHFHEGFGVVASGNHAAIVVAQDDDRDLGQVRTKHTLAARIKAVAVDQREDRLKFFHGRERCSEPHPRWPARRIP